MASQAVTIAGAVINNSSADKAIFSNKGSPSDLLQTDKEDSSSSKGSTGSDTPLKPKDFYWDQILFYLVSAILGLSFLDISVEFFRGSVVQCNTAPENITQRDQVAYLNNYCYDSLPNSQYYLIFILLSALVIIAPHYLWVSYFGAHFDFFFDLVRKLNRLRDTNTGEYSPYNFELVKKLEQKFSSSNAGIFRLYQLKLLAQLIVCLIVQTVNAFYFKQEDFEESFPCPSDISRINSTIWPLEMQLYCVYNSLKLLYFLRNTALGLVSAAVVVIIFGLVWCYIRHTTELGAADIAAFCDVSCLPPEEYPYPSARKVIRKIFYCGKEERLLDKYQPRSTTEEETEKENKLCCPCFNGFLKGLQLAFSPRIRTDLDFLVTRLFYADSGHGQVFKDIQIQKELDGKISQDHELLYLLNSVHSHLLRKRIKKKLALRRRGLTASNEPDSLEWERLKDLKKYFYESKFDGSNPEEQVYSYFQSKMGVTLKDWSHSPLRSVLFGFLQFAPQNKFAIDISFGNRTGHSLVLARAFYHVVTVHFNKYYKNPKEICREENYQANFRTFTFQANIFSQNARNITQSELLIINLFNELGTEIRKLDLIVIGPMSDRSKIVTTNLLIEKIYAREVYFSKGAILLAIRPLMIGAKSCTEHFIQYQPPEGIFKDINDEVLEKLAASNIPVYSVSPKGVIKKIEQPRQFYQRQFSTASHATRPQRAGTLTRLKSIVVPKEDKPLPCGLAIECNNVPCLYEFRAFRYISEEDSPETDNPLSNEVTYTFGEDNTAIDEEESSVIPTDRLVSPILSPSLPNLLSQFYQVSGSGSGSGTSHSEPTLFDSKPEEFNDVP